MCVNGEPTEKSLLGHRLEVAVKLVYWFQQSLCMELNQYSDTLVGSHDVPFTFRGYCVAKPRTPWPVSKSVWLKARSEF
jgi:hypothetical protein